MPEEESSQELFTSDREEETADQTQESSSHTSLSSDQEEQESAASGQQQGETVPDQNGRVSHELQAENSIPQETPDDEQCDIALVERAYAYLTKGAYPEGATKNEKRSIRRKAERLKEENGELYYKKRSGVKVSEFRDKMLLLHAYI